jgi:type II secretory pathway predicted ATPase ExeA
MLCGLCGRIDTLVAGGDIVSMTEISDLIKSDEELVKWWDNHKLQDAKRRLAEQVKKRERAVKRKAIEKLTDEELKTLGLERPKKRVRK